MRQKRNVAYYAAIIAKETGIPRWKVHLTLMFAWQNVCTALYKGEEVRLKKFGRIYFTKNKTDNHGTHHPRPDQKRIGPEHLLEPLQPRKDPWLD